jgi:hypothetical protein
MSPVMHGRGEGILTGCGLDRANVSQWTEDLLLITCPGCLGDTPDAGTDVEALAREIREELPGLGFGKPEQIAHIVRTSDWLARSLAQARAEGAKVDEIFASIEKAAARSTNYDGDLIGYFIGVEDFRCLRAAARAAAQQAGGGS